MCRTAFAAYCLTFASVGLLLDIASLAAAPPVTVSADADYSGELPRIEPRSPEAALDAFELAPGFEISLVAAEPLVQDPIALAFDARGRMFVVEMRDYSEQATEALGRIALLVDDNHDGRMDRRSTFAESLSWPTALWPWRDGVLVLAPPELIFFRDTDDDGVADQREVWCRGFHRSNVQGMANSLRWTLDNTIHGATSSSGADLRFPPDSADPAQLSLRGRDFIIDPVRQQFRAATGGGQHGLAFNRWDDKFVTSNSDHLQQIVDLQAWPFHDRAAISTRRSIAADGPQAEVFRASPVEPWRIVRTRLRVSGTVPGPVEGGGRAAGYFTGATGTLIMDAELGFGDPLFDTAIVSDVGSNLVHRKRLVPEEVYYRGQRIDDQTEWLRSHDIWFRPVQLTDGPDQAVYIADMYREVIEHPASLPPVIKRHLDLTSGNDRGRIWRVRPTQRLPAFDAVVDLTSLTNAELVARLHHPLAWHRRMASQLLVERDAADVTELLKQSCNATSPPTTVVHALYLLDHFQQLDDGTLLSSMQHPHRRVVQHAMKLARHSQRWALVSQVLPSLVESDDPHVRLDLLLTLAEPQLESRERYLLKLFAKSSSSPLLQSVWIAAAGEATVELLEAPDEIRSLPETEARRWLQGLVPIWSQQLDRPGEDPVKNRVRQALAQALSDENFRRLWIDQLASLRSASAAVRLIDSAGSESQALMLREIEQTVTRYVNDSQPDGAKDLALRWLRLLPDGPREQLAEQWMTPELGDREQVILIDSLLWADGSAEAAWLIERIFSFTPNVREACIEQMLNHADSATVLLTALTSTTEQPPHVPLTFLSANHRQRMLNHPQVELRKGFTALLGGSSQRERQAVVEEYLRHGVSSAVDAARMQSGKQLFESKCATCHRLRHQGADVGPPLDPVISKTREQLATSILDPNREVDPRYQGYAVLMTDGRIISGVIRSESAQQLELLEAGGKLHYLPRAEIEQLRATGVSLMPEGLEQQLSPTQFGSLLDYLQHGS